MLRETGLLSLASFTELRGWLVATSLRFPQSFWNTGKKISVQSCESLPQEGWEGWSKVWGDKASGQGLPWWLHSCPGQLWLLVANLESVRSCGERPPVVGEAKRSWAPQQVLGEGASALWTPLIQLVPASASQQGSPCSLLFCFGRVGVEETDRRAHV